VSNGTIEIITGRERRRRWSVEEKLRIVAETEQSGARVTEVAARHGVYPGLLFTKRRQVRDGVLSAPPAATFMPVRMRRRLIPMSSPFGVFLVAIALMAALGSTPVSAQRGGGGGGFRGGGFQGGFNRGFVGPGFNRGFVGPRFGFNHAFVGPRFGFNRGFFNPHFGFFEPRVFIAPGVVAAPYPYYPYAYYPYPYYPNYPPY